MEKTKKQILMGSRKSQIPATLTWFPAMFIIFFVMLLYIAGAGALAGKAQVTKWVSFGRDGGFNEITTAEVSEITYAQRQLFIFLNSPVEFEGREMQVKDLIYSEEIEKDKFELFITTVEKFMDENFEAGRGERYKKTWFRIYAPDEDIWDKADAKKETIRTEVLKYGKYQFYDGVGVSSLHAVQCSLEKGQLISVYIESNKFVVMCLEKY